jgi:hypothetical protein
MVAGQVEEAMAAPGGNGEEVRLRGSMEQASWGFSSLFVFPFDGSRGGEEMEEGTDGSRGGEEMEEGTDGSRGGGGWRREPMHVDCSDSDIVSLFVL